MKNLERGETNRPYEITSQLADDNFKHYHRGAAIYTRFGNDEWRFNRLFVSEDSIRLLDGPPTQRRVPKEGRHGCRQAAPHSAIFVEHRVGL
jgi:hypothetical protein